MFVFNVKLNSKNIVKIALVLISIIVVILFILSLYRILNSSFKVRDNIEEVDIVYIKPEEYTNILKNTYENIDLYVGKKICFSGYVYRCFDFSDNQFVLARNMIIGNNPEALIVGFLCSSKNAKDFPDNTWVEITGVITKGNYHGEVPVIQIIKIEQIEKPSDEYVYPPDDTYLQTKLL